METSSIDTLFAFFAGETLRGIVLSVGVLIALISVVTARGIARKKQTADLLFSCRNDHLLTNGMKTIRISANSPTVNLAAHVQPESAHSDIAISVRYVLNHFEYLSIGIQAGIYDEEMLRKALRRTMLVVYRCSKGYIEAMRMEHKTDTLYQEFQWLAVRWEEKKLSVRFPQGA